MDEDIENSGEESDNDSILDLDLNPDGVIRPSMFDIVIAKQTGQNGTDDFRSMKIHIFALR